MVLWGFVFNCLHYSLFRCDFQALALLSDEIASADQVEVKGDFTLTGLRHMKTVTEPASSSFSMQKHVVTSKVMLPPDKQTQGSHWCAEAQFQSVMLASLR